MSDKSKIQLDNYKNRLESEAAAKQKAINAMKDNQIDLSFITDLSQENILRGIVYSEVLGKPLAKRRARW